MKSKFFILISLIFCSLSSCTKKSSNSSFYLDNAEQLLQDFNRGKHSHDKGELLEGQVYLRAASENRIAVYVESPSIEGTLLYLLQMEGLKDQNFKSILPKAQILFLKESLIINSLEDEKKFLLKLAPAQNLIPNEDVTLFNGFGLSRHLGYTFNFTGTAFARDGTGGDPGDPPGILVSCKCRLNGTTHTCSSGGVGSTSCSKSFAGESCSVDCATGYYACCKAQ